MKKKLILKYFIFIFLFSFNQVIAEECDLEFEIGDDASKAIFLYGEPKDDPERSYLYIEEQLKFVCPDHGMEDAMIYILLSDDEIGGYKINSYTNKEDKDDEKKFIYFYVKENFGNIKEVQDLNSPDWTGSISWEINNIYYYYYKFSKNNNRRVEEELFVTKEKFGKYFK